MPLPGPRLVGPTRENSGWPLGDRRSRVVAAVLLVLFGAYAAGFFGVTASRVAQHPAGSDFFALWYTARFAATHPPAEVYDAARLHAALLAQGMSAQSDYPFPYPPFFLFALWPLGRLAYLPAYLVAMTGSLGLYLWATLGRDRRLLTTAAALLAPTTTVALVAGQAGLLAAALLIGGCRLLTRRPIVAGILFGLLSFKPQLGLLLPIALIAAREWRAIGAAAATAAVLVAGSAAAFGTDIWPAWAAAIAPYAGEFASATAGRLGHLMPTVAAASHALGAGSILSGSAQITAAAVAGGAVWRCFRAGAGRLAAAALFVAAFLATPHAFVYDMPPVTTAVLWLIVERQRAAAPPFAPSEALVMVAALLAPVALVAGPFGPPFAVLALALLLTVIVRRRGEIAPVRS